MSEEIQSTVRAVLMHFPIACAALSFPSTMKARIREALRFFHKFVLFSCSVCEFPGRKVSDTIICGECLSGPRQEKLVVGLQILTRFNRISNRVSVAVFFFAAHCARITHQGNVIEFSKAVFRR